MFLTSWLTAFRVTGSTAAAWRRRQPRQPLLSRRRRLQPQSWHIEVLEDRSLLSTFTFTGSDGDWSNTANWSPNALPGAADIAVIDVASNVTLINTSGTIAGLQSTNGVTLGGGSLTVEGDITLGGTLTVSAGQLLLDGTSLNNDLKLSGGTLFVDNGLTLANSATLKVGDALDNAGTVLVNYVSQVSSSIVGTGSILFGTSTSNSISTFSGTALTIGAGITIHGDQGSVNAETLVNAGTIASDVSGGLIQINVSVATNSTFTNSKTLSASNGGTLSIFSDWTSDGLDSEISVSDASTLNMGGSFATSSLASLVRTGATTVNITGTLDNTGATLALTAGTGSYHLVSGGTILNGDYTSDGDGSLVIAYGTLDGVTVKSDLSVSNFGTLTVAGDLILDNAAIRLGSASDEDDYGGLNFNPRSGESTTTLSGQGSVVFGKSTNNTINIAAPLTVGPDITIRGENGYVYGDSLINQGLVSADVNGGDLDFDNYSGTFQNSGAGRFEAINGGHLFINDLGAGNVGAASLVGIGSRLGLDGNGYILDQPLAIGDGQSLELSGNWSNASTLSLSGSGVLRFGGDFRTTDIGQFIRNNGTDGTVILTGTLDLTDQGSGADTLTLDSSTGSWYVQAGGIIGGTYTSSGGALLIFEIDEGGGRLDNVTLNSDVKVLNGAINVLNTLTIGSGATVYLGSEDGSTTGRIVVQAGTPPAAYEILGLGSIVFGGSSDNEIIANAPLTINAGITITGGRGHIGAPLIANYGTIIADGPDAIIAIDPDYDDDPLSFQNYGQMTAKAGGRLILNGQWTNVTSTGIISVEDDSIIELSGEFAVADIGTLSRTGNDNSVVLAGILHNTGTELALSSLTGDWIVDGGTIEGGTYSSSTGGKLLVAYGTLDGVTVNGDLSLLEFGTLVIDGGLILNGQVALAGDFASVTFYGTQSVTTSSTGEFLLSGNSTYIYLSYNANDTLTIGPAVTFRTPDDLQPNGYPFTGFYGDSTLVNQGQILMDDPQGYLAISPGTFSNEGLVSTKGTLAFDGNVSITGTGAISGAPSSHVHFGSGNITGNTQNASGFNLAGEVQFGYGQSTRTQTLEVMGVDHGAVAAGFSSNFVYGTVKVTPFTTLQLVNNSKNTANQSLEAVYVKSLTVESNAVLDLNGLNLYAYSADISGTVVNGTVSLFFVNQAPTLGFIDDQTIGVDSGTHFATLHQVGSGAPTEHQGLIVTATSDNPGLVPDPTVLYTSPNSSGSLSFAPVSGQSGQATITVTVQDDGGTDNGGQNTFFRTFTIDVVAGGGGTGTIGGRAVIDPAGDGQNLATAQGAVGFTIFLDTDENGELDSGEPYTVTNSTGNYSFINLAPGSYRVTEVVPSGYVVTAPFSGFQIVNVGSSFVGGPTIGNYQTSHPVYWVSLVSGDASVPANWSTGSVPGSPDDVFINVSDPNVVVTHSVGTTTIHSLHSKNKLALTGGELSIDAPSQVHSTVTFSGGTLSGNGSVLIDNLNLTGGTQTGTGITTVQSTFQLGGLPGDTRLLDGRMLRLALGSSSTWTGAKLTLSNGAVLKNEGTFQVQGSGDILAGGANPGQIQNSGTFQTGPGGYTNNVYVPFQNSGVLQLGGGTFTLHAGLSSSGITNIGSASLVVEQNFVVNGFGTVSQSAGGVLTLLGNLQGGTTNSNGWQLGGAVQFTGWGSSEVPQLLEVMGEDRGAVATGLTGNFAYGTLSLGNGTYVQLHDLSDNSTGTGAEALYVDTLVVPAGTTLDLNGLKVYAKHVQIAGTVTGGTPILISQGGPAPVINPTVTSVTRSSPPGALTGAATVTFSVTFSEPVSGVQASSFTITAGAGIQGAAVTNVGGSGSTYSVTVSTGSGGAGGSSDTLRLDVNTTTVISGQSNGGTFATPFTSGQSYIIDRQAPTVASTGPAQATPTNSPTVTFLVTFSESVSGVGAANFTPVAGGAVSGASVASVTGSGNTYTVTVNTGTGGAGATADTLRLNVNASPPIVDQAGNALVASFTSGSAYVIDRQAPTVVSSNIAGVSPTSAATANFTVTFNEAVTGVTADSFVAVAGGGITGAAVTGVSGSGSVYTVTVNTGNGATGAAADTLRLDVKPQSQIRDLAGNLLSAGFTSGQSYIVNARAPAVESSVRAGNSPTNAATVSFTVTFTEPVSGVGTSSFAVAAGSSISGASVVSVSGTGRVYTVVVNTGTGGTGSATSTIRLDVNGQSTIRNAANQPLAGPFTTGQSYTIDKLAPTVLSSSPAAGAQSGASTINFVVTFSEAVTGVTAGNFSVTSGGAVTGASVTGISGSGSVYTVTVNTGTGGTGTPADTIRLNVNPQAASPVTDASGNLFGAAFNTGAAAIINKSALSVQSSTRLDREATNQPAVRFAVSFNVPVTGVSNADFAIVSNASLGGASITDISGSGSQYVVTVATGSRTSGSGPYTLRLDVVANGTMRDAADKPLTTPFISGQDYLIDRVPPTVTVSANAGPSLVTSTAPVTFNVTFSEPVTGFSPAGVTLTGTAAAGANVLVTGSGTQYQVAVSGMTVNGTLSVSLPAGAASDAAGNPSSASGSATSSFNGLAPIANPVIVSTSEGTPLSFRLTGRSFEPGPENISFVLQSSPANGSLVQFDTATGSVTYAPAAGFLGSDTLRFAVVDLAAPGGPLTSAAATVTLIVNPVVRFPTLDPIASRSVPQNSPGNIVVRNVNLTGISSGNVNGDNAVQITARSNNAALILPPSVTLGAEGTGVVSFIPVSGQTGSAIITVTVTSSAGSISRSFAVTVTPPKPLSAFSNATEFLLPVDGNGRVTGTITNPGDFTFFRFTSSFTGLISVNSAQSRAPLASVPGGSSSPIRFPLNSSVEAGADTFLNIYDDDQNLLRFGTNPNVNTTISVTEGETYFLQVRGAAQTTGSFAYDIVRLDTTEGHDFNRPTVLDISGDHGQLFSVNGTISIAGLDDYYTFVAPASGQITIAQTAIGSGTDSTAELDTVLTVYGDNRGLVSRNDDLVPGSNTNSLVRFNATVGQTYFIRAGSFGETTGAYNLTASLVALDGYGHTFRDSVQLPLDAAGTAEFTGRLAPNDKHFFSFVPEFSGRATLSLQAESGSDADLLRAYDGSRTRTASAQGATRQTQINVLAGQLYYLQIASSTNGGGGYRLRVSIAAGEVDTTPDPAAPSLTSVNSIHAALDNSITTTLSQLGEFDDAQRKQASANINAAFVNEFIAQFGGLQNLPASYFIAWFDPVDFIVTDSDNRQVGFTQANGAINEVGRGVYFSGDGATEILIIPNASAGSFSLQLVGVGSGSFLAGANFVSPAGVQTVTIQDSLLKGSAVVQLDFGAKPGSGTTGGTGGSGNGLVTSELGGAAAQLIASTSTLAVSASSTSSAVNLPNRPIEFSLGSALNLSAVSDNAQTGSREGSGAADQALVLLEWVRPAARSGSVLRSMATAIHWPFQSVLVGEGAGDPDQADERSAAQQELFDRFWSGVSRRILGLDAVNLEPFHLDALFGKFVQPKKSAEQQPPRVQQPEAGRKQTQTPADQRAQPQDGQEKARRENTPAPTPKATQTTSAANPGQQPPPQAGRRPGEQNPPVAERSARAQSKAQRPVD